MMLPATSRVSAGLNIKCYDLVHPNLPRRETWPIGVVTARKAPAVIWAVRVVRAVITTCPRVVRRTPGAVDDVNVIVPVVIIMIMTIVIMSIMIVIMVIMVIMVVVVVGAG
jgi:hypothetical protein